MCVSRARSCGHVGMRCVGGEVVPVCVWRRLGDDKAKRIRNELDWLLSMGLMWQRISNGAEGQCALLAAHVVYYMPRMRWSVVYKLLGYQTIHKDGRCWWRRRA